MCDILQSTDLIEADDEAPQIVEGLQTFYFLQPVAVEIEQLDVGKCRCIGVLQQDILRYLHNSVSVMKRLIFLLI